MTKTRAFIFGATSVLALGFIVAPVSFDAGGLGIDTAAAAGKSGGYDKDCPHVKKMKGNNGWGNGGGDGTNPGSDEGATAGTKLPDEER